MTKAPGVRARVRAELTAEIKQQARTQLETQGAAALSLRAIAREMEMASSAIYRYFASRDDLLTALIIDAYDSIGQAAEDSHAHCDPYDYRGRLIAIGRAVREWAVRHQHEYALIYGSPVPGYAAPQDTIDPATRVPELLLTVLVEHFAGDEPADLAGVDPTLLASLDGLMGYTSAMVRPELLARGVQAWSEIFGFVSLELFGHFEQTVTDPGAFFEHALAAMADRVLAA